MVTESLKSFILSTVRLFEKDMVEEILDRSLTVLTNKTHNEESIEKPIENAQRIDEDQT